MVEVTDTALISLAVPLGGEGAVEKALTKVFGLNIPDPKISSTSAGIRAVRTSPDQMLLLIDGKPNLSGEEVADSLGGTAYTTRQTDSWVMCSLSGKGARVALERLCPIDLHDDAFPVDAAARTVMEHMSAIIIRTGSDDYLLMSASSSAKSFAHAITLSMRYVTPD